MSETRDLYMSRKQQVIYYSGARDQRVLAARRFGKTDGVIGPHCIRVTQSMPQGAGAWMGNSKTQLFTKTVPATIAAIERWGLKEGVHFVWGRPNDKLGFQRPIVKPKEWSNVISFYNGFVWYLASLEVKGIEWYHPPIGRPPIQQREPVVQGHDVRLRCCPLH